MFDHGALRLLLRKPLLAIAGVGAGTIPVGFFVPAAQYIEFENRVFIPPDPNSQPVWMRETYLAGDDALTSTGTLQTNGIYQLDVFSLAGGGTEGPEAIIRSLSSAYIPSTGLDDGKGVTLEVVRTCPLAGKPFSDLWYMRPVQITFRSFTPNSIAGNVVSVAAAGATAKWTFSVECNVANVLSPQCIITVAGTPFAPTGIVGSPGAHDITYGYAVGTAGGTWALAAKPAAVSVPGGIFLAPESGGALS